VETRDGETERGRNERERTSDLPLSSSADLLTNEVEPPLCRFVYSIEPDDDSNKKPKASSVSSDVALLISFARFVNVQGVVFIN